jgi:3-vinyl bacteriochlorophyllide hydratase
LHSVYVLGLLTGWIETRQLMLLALAAYASYALNAAQFLLKLRAARLQAIPLDAIGMDQMKSYS